MVEEIAALASRLSRRLRKRGWSIATAESCTGGLLASTFTDISGATSWFDQGWVVYNNEGKMRELGGEISLRPRGSGAVSHQVALQMARGARYRSDAEVSIAITGIAGPGATPTKVGLVHVAVTAGDQFIVRRRDFGENDRLDNKKSFVSFALRLSLELLDRVVEEEERLAAVESRSEGGEEQQPESMILNQNNGKVTCLGRIGKQILSPMNSKVDLASLTDWDE